MKLCISLHHIYIINTVSFNLHEITEVLLYEKKFNNGDVNTVTVSSVTSNTKVVISSKQTSRFVAVAMLLSGRFVECRVSVE